MKKINWKAETTWIAIGGGLITILTATGLLVGEESLAASTVVANLTAGTIGLIMLIRSIRNRVKADDAPEELPEELPEDDA